jgi:hypothetical protein
MAVESFLIICPIHFHFCSIICTAICFSCACLHSSPFKKMFGQKILKIFLKPPTKNVCRSLLIHFITFHISYPYRSKDLTYLPKILNFVPIDISLSLPRLIKLNKNCICVLNPYFYTFPAPPVLVTTLLRYENLFSSSLSFSFILIFCHFLH